MIVESKIFRIFIKSAFWTSIIIALLIIFMIGNFIFKITFLDYRFDDGELIRPVEATSDDEYFLN